MFCSASSCRERELELPLGGRETTECLRHGGSSSREPGWHRIRQEAGFLRFGVLANRGQLGRMIRGLWPLGDLVCQMADAAVRAGQAAMVVDDIAEHGGEDQQG